MNLPIQKQPSLTLPEMPAEETYLQGVWYRFKRHKLAMISLFFLLLISVAAIAAPQISRHDYREVMPSRSLQAPSREHLMGTDRLGRDVFSRALLGGRISLIVGFTAAFVAVIVGTLVGVVAGYFGGWVDDILMRLTDVFMAFPVLFLLLTIAAVLPKTVTNIVLVIGLTSWPSLARTVRGQFLSLREMEFVEAARSLGVKNYRIALSYILPNTVAPIIVGATLRIGGAILAEAGLAFIGVGIIDPPSWGSILDAGRAVLRQAPWITFFPGMLIFITVLAFNFVGDGLRDALDPKLK
ncbi:MAG: peptide/nickel transport system permease protein [Bacillota bacterium]|nr:MAG: peptide/nickel transport system permease protein [Bacillota bacterium]